MIIMTSCMIMVVNFITFIECTLLHSVKCLTTLNFKIKKVDKMKTLSNLTELNTLTKSELNDISVKLFNRRLPDNKADHIHELNYSLNNDGNEKYNLILINKILSNNLRPSTQFIKCSDVLVIKYLWVYERFLYTYHLGFKALYKDRIKDIKGYQVDYGHVFDNQFNTDTKRILEWDYFIIPSKGYNTLTEVRNNTFKCGYCGKQYKKEDALKIEYCTACRGSEFLEINNYPLLKLKAISDKSRYKDITIPDNMKADIIKQQKATKEKNIKKEIANNKERLKRKIAEIKQETKVLNYLLNNDDFMLLHGIYIYYTHSNTLDFTYKSEKMNDDLKSIVLKYKDDIESKLNITVKV